jgi:hypothetical protein
VARRRRRRDRRDATEHGPAQPERREKRAEDKRRQTFEAEQDSLRRRRRFVGALAFLPLLGMLGCGGGILPLCQIPGEWWWAGFAAIFGSYLGINLRLFLERRRFRRAIASG